MSLDSEFPERVDHLAEEFVDRCRRGEQVSIEEYVSRYPELAEFIRDLFPTLLTVEKLKLPQGDESRLDASVDAVRQQSSQWPCFTDYKIIREIARGGMGIVYEAEQRSLSRRVALKVLASPHLCHDNLKQRFLNEARSLATLHHTNIIPIFEVGEEDGVDYYSMQYIDGESLHFIQAEVASLLKTKRGDESDAASSLAQRLAQSLISDVVIESDDNASSEPALGPEETAKPRLRSISGVRAYCRNIAKLGVQAADAVDYAHRKGIIHRDIKPVNLLLDRSGTLWIADFGLAKFEDHDLTRTGDVIGTLRYMAPERFNRTCDERSDIYSLGLSI